MSETAWGQGIQSRKEQRQMKRQALLQTAAKTFNEIGFHQTTLDDLAQRLHVTKPTLYYYIKNKDDILFECNRLGLERMKHALAIAEEQGKNGREKLRILLRFYTEVLTEDIGACLVLSGDQALTEENRAKLRSTRLELDRAVRRILEEGIQDGSIAACNPKLATFAIYGAFNWVAHWYNQEGELTPMEIADQIFQLFENGLAPRV